MSTTGHVAIVVQRYGPQITGGSEALARALAERLVGERDVSVLTTRAIDYVTWRNQLPEGEQRVNGVRVHRFGVEAERNLDDFNTLSEQLYAGSPTREQELDWLVRQGPLVPALVEALREDAHRYSAILFFTYLYYPTYWGLKAAPGHSILVPTTHDEPPLRFGIFRDVFAAPRALAFLTPPEADLVADRFEIGDRPTAVTGIGIDTPAATDPDRFKTRYDVLSPYLLYAGRIDAGKGCAELLEFYERYRRDVRGAAQLILIGRLAMPEPRVPGVRYLGYLSEQEKLDAMAGATAVVCPSPYESLSITLLEALGLGTPVIASARSPVLVDHCRRSGAGLYYGEAREFLESVELLVRRDELASKLGAAGRRYVDGEYRWNVVLGRYRALIDAVAGS